VSDHCSLLETVVFGDNQWGLAAELEGDSFKSLGTVRLDELADLSGTSECNLVNLGVVDESTTGGRTEAGNDVDDTGGETSFDTELAEVDSGEL